MSAQPPSPSPGQAMRPAHLALLATTVLLLLLPVGAAGGWVWSKHRAAQQRLEDLAPRHARLLGVQAQQAQIQQALQGLQAIQAKHVYPAQEDASQTGNALQQRLRDVLGASKLSILSSQVRVVPPQAPSSYQPQPEGELAGYERIEILIAADGGWEDIQQALLAVGDIRPTVWLDDMRIQLMGNLQTQRPEHPVRLQVQWVFHVLRRTAS